MTPRSPFRSPLKSQRTMETSEGYPSPNAQVSNVQLREAYNEIYYSFQKQNKTIATLQDSLKKEVLAAEEMRAYVEVLKQAVSSKEHEAKTLPNNPRVNNRPGAKLNEYALKKQDQMVNNL